MADDKKYCSYCKKEHSVKEFPKNARAKDKLNTKCKKYFAWRMRNKRQGLEYELDNIVRKYQLANFSL